MFELETSGFFIFEVFDLLKVSILSCRGQHLLLYKITKIKGPSIWKANCQPVNSSQKRTNELVFTTMQPVFVCFLEKIEVTKKTFQNHLTFSRLECQKKDVQIVKKKSWSS